MKLAHCLQYVATAALLVAGAARLAYADRPLTRGRIPDEAIKDGVMDRRLVPDYIPALQSDGTVAGYIATDALIGGEEPLVVVDETLSETVGHFVGGVGFVPLGTSAESLPRHMDMPPNARPRPNVPAH